MHEQWFWPTLAFRSEVLWWLDDVVLVAHNHYILARYSCGTRYNGVWLVKRDAGSW